MSKGRLLVIVGFLFLSGCLYHARENVDEAVCHLAARPYDPQPVLPAETKPKTPDSSPQPDKGAKSGLPDQAIDIQTTSYMQPDKDPKKPEDKLKFPEIKIPPEIPGSEVKPIDLRGKTEAERRRILEQLYPKLSPLPQGPAAVPGPGGVPYTLATLQQIAAANSPMLRQAASDVEAAKGAVQQASAYPNPTVSYQAQPSNDGSIAGAQGFGVDQRIIFFGKLKLASSAAEMDLANAELALRRARSDLSTAVRNAYFGVLVAKEAVRVTKALARFTDEVYRYQAEGILKPGFAGPYEPAGLRAQAYTARLGYKQAISTYVYSWKQLVAALGLRQLPLTEVAGRLDTAIPYFDYDTILHHVLQNHTDVLIAGNTIDKARYNLKLAQITPFPDFDVNVALLKEFSLPPKQFVHTLTLGMPLPIWDRNKGNIRAAEAALVRATEEPHRVAEGLTNTLAIAYTGYKNNLDALEYYRRYILRDQVRYYLGISRRRQIEGAVAFGDMVAAQQTLAANVTAYLGVLGSMWSSVVSVADLLQTDDLFQMGKPLPVPALPDLEHLPAWPCCHDCAGAHGSPGCPGGSGPQGAGAPVVPLVPSASGGVLPEPKKLATPAPSAKDESVDDMADGEEESADEVPVPSSADKTEGTVLNLHEQGKKGPAKLPDALSSDGPILDVPLLPAPGETRPAKFPALPSSDDTNGEVPLPPAPGPEGSTGASAPPPPESLGLPAVSEERPAGNKAP